MKWQISCSPGLTFINYFHRLVHYFTDKQRSSVARGGAEGAASETIFQRSSSKPNARLRFCMACVAAPLSRLSRVATTTTRLPPGRHGESADLGVVPAGDTADPGRFVDDTDQRLARIAGPIACHGFLPRFSGFVQPQVHGHGDAAEMRRHMRHELHRHAAGGARLRARARGRPARKASGCRAACRGRSCPKAWCPAPRVAGYAKALRRPGEHVEHRRDGELHRRGIAARDC